jgi:hypothetical protein
VPGRGHGSPCVYGGRIFLPTADEQAETQSILCYNAEDGTLLWQQDAGRGGFPGKGGMHRESSHASATPACDGERVFAAFLRDGAVHVSAWSLEGEPLWDVEAGPFQPKFGYAPSPSFYGPYVIVAGDHMGGGFLAAIDRESGEIVWRVTRPARSTYSSPLIIEAEGRPHVFMAGADRVACYDPATGALNWQVDGTTEAVAGTPVFGSSLIFASGGYPGSETIAVRPRPGSPPEIAWQVRPHAYVPSLLWANGLLFVIDDDGAAYCLDAASGETRWRERLRGRLFRGSPVWVDGHVLVTNVEGLTYVFEATGEGFRPVAENQLGDECYASAAVVGDRLFYRVADLSGGRRERLVCIGR